MRISLTQLQGYNIMHKLLNSYYDKTKLEDIMLLLPGMFFLYDNNTADPAIWEDWIEAINDKKKLTKQEAFDGMIRFFEAYYMLVPYNYLKTLLDEMSSAKNCNDETIPIVRQWNTHLKEVLLEPKDSRTYLQPAQK